MHIVFVHNKYESLSLEYLSAALKRAGHEVSLVFEKYSALKSERTRLLRETAAKAAVLKPDLVGFSIDTYNFSWAMRVAGLIKEGCGDVPVICGGPQAVITPEAVLMHEAVDMVCIGEGEEAVVELADVLARGGDHQRIRNFWVRTPGGIVKNELRPLIDDLDRVPGPDKALFFDCQPWMSREYLVLTSRGCPYDCAYCLNSVMKARYRGRGRFLRARSVGHVLKELRRAKEMFRPHHIAIVDANFPRDIRWLREFVERYREEVAVPFTCESHPHFVTAELTALLKRAGCYLLEMGVETVNEEMRVGKLSRYGTNDEIIRAAANCRREGIPFSVNHIFNMPRETTGDRAEALRFYNTIRPSLILPLPLIYYSKQPVVQWAREEGILDEEHVKRLDDGGYIDSPSLTPEAQDEFYNFWLACVLLPLLPVRVVSAIVALLKRKPAPISFRYRWFRMVFHIAEVILIRRRFGQSYQNLRSLAYLFVMVKQTIRGTIRR